VPLVHRNTGVDTYPLGQVDDDGHVKRASCWRWRRGLTELAKHLNPLLDTVERFLESLDAAGVDAVSYPPEDLDDEG